MRRWRRSIIRIPRPRPRRPRSRPPIPETSGQSQGTDWLRDSAAPAPDRVVVGVGAGAGLVPGERIGSEGAGADRELTHYTIAQPLAPVPSQAVPEPATAEPARETAEAESPAPVPVPDSLPSPPPDPMPPSEPLPTPGTPPLPSPSTPMETPSGSEHGASRRPRHFRTRPNRCRNRNRNNNRSCRRQRTILREVPGRTSAVPPAASESASPPAQAPAQAQTPEPSPTVSEPPPAGNGGPRSCRRRCRSSSRSPRPLAASPIPISRRNHRNRQPGEGHGTTGQAFGTILAGPVDDRFPTVGIGGPEPHERGAERLGVAGEVEPDVAKAPTVNPFADAGAVAGQGGWGAPDPRTPGDADGPGRGTPASAAAFSRNGVAHPGAGPRSRPSRTSSGAARTSGPSRGCTTDRAGLQGALEGQQRQVPAPEKLRVGQTIGSPPPESLERSLVLPPGTVPDPDAAPATSVHRTSAGRRRRPVRHRRRAALEVELALPVADPFENSEPGPPDGRRPRPARGASDRPRPPVYKVHPRDTLRSIARDTLGDSRRAGEILELNRDVIDDPNHPTRARSSTSPTMPGWHARPAEKAGPSG